MDIFFFNPSMRNKVKPFYQTFFKIASTPLEKLLQ
jgi:hypothetical protein